jgi:hypothetical protein
MTVVSGQFLCSTLVGVDETPHTLLGRPVSIYRDEIEERPPEVRTRQPPEMRKNAAPPPPGDGDDAASAAEVRPGPRRRR